MYFPTEIWYQIKSYEFQLKYPQYIQKQYRSYIFSMVRLPFFLKHHRKKNINYLYNDLRKNHAFLWEVFQDKYIQHLIRKELNHMNNNFDKIYLKQICCGSF